MQILRNNNLGHIYRILPIYTLWLFNHTNPQKSLGEKSLHKTSLKYKIWHFSTMAAAVLQHFLLGCRGLHVRIGPVPPFPGWYSSHVYQEEGFFCFVWQDKNGRDTLKRRILWMSKSLVTRKDFRKAAPHPPKRLAGKMSSQDYRISSTGC